MGYVLTKDSLVSSARIIADELDLDIRYAPLKVNGSPVPPDVRWGTSIGWDMFGVNDSQYNRADQIAVCGNKIALSRLLVANNVPTIEFKKTEPYVFPIAVRRVLNGHGGDGIIICRDIEEWGDHMGLFWSPWYKFEFELGVHVLGGEVVKVFKKIWQDTVDTEPEFPIRNMERGYHFSSRNIDNYSKLPAFVSNFYSKVPINMTRLDIGWDAINRTYRVIEANTAPALTSNPDTARKYIDYLKRVFGRE